MSYERYRADLIGSYFDYQLESFLTRYHPSKKTLILLPGGMGSQLERTESPYPNSPNVITDVVWLDLGIAPPSLDGLKLEIDLQGKDKDSYVVAPHGPIAFIGVTPYEKLEDKTVTDMLQDMVTSLDPREATILRYRFGLDGGSEKTLEEVGEKFGVTRERVRQIQNIALRKLRKMIEKLESVKK